MGRIEADSPTRAGGSSRRERSPIRHRSSNAEKLSTRKRSPIRERSRSPVSDSPVIEKRSTSLRLSPKHREPQGEKPLSRTRSPKHMKLRSPEPRSPILEKLTSRTSPRRLKARPSLSQSPKKEKLSSRSRSPSPRSKRLRRANTERGNERHHEKHYDKNDDRATRKEREPEKESTISRKHNRQGRDPIDNGSKVRPRSSASPSDRHRRGQRRSRSPSSADDRSRDELAYSRGSEQRNGDNDSLNKMKAAEKTLEEKEKQKPSFELSGKLAAETNRFRGITLLFNEPSDARKPDIRWRLYVFKGGEVLNEPLYVHRQSCYLFGRERRVADIPTDHPSCSKQHAVLQYRQVDVENSDGIISKKVRPYVMDLGSTNGTFINDNQIDPQRYYELFEKDTMKFGNSSREYVLLHENSTG